MTTVRSPVGPLTIAARQDRLCVLHFGAATETVTALMGRWYKGETVRSCADPAGVVSGLSRYFCGNLAALDTIEVALNGTPFQMRVWQALRSVRAGTTASYAELARRVGAPAAVRAVGAANGANPVAIVVPCHRIIGTNGKLTGYGGGIERKRWLL
jgi:methylated-DNA-[protein]-cysteine S-methyltransferase